MASQACFLSWPLEVLGDSHREWVPCTQSGSIRQCWDLACISPGAKHRESILTERGKRPPSARTWPLEAPRIGPSSRGVTCSGGACRAGCAMHIGGRAGAGQGAG